MTRTFLRLTMSETFEDLRDGTLDSMTNLETSKSRIPHFHLIMNFLNFFFWNKFRKKIQEISQRIHVLIWKRSR